jgi:RNA polymerase sigma-70 factor (ECF subfamily)
MSLAKRWPLTGMEDEADLVLAAAGRDAAAFGELYRRYVTRIYRYLYSHVGNSADAEDITAQVFTSAWEGIHHYREQGAFSAWLFRIARNKANDHHRRRRAQVSLEETHLLENWDPQAHVERGEALRRLAELVERLDAERLELLRLRFAADMSYAEMAGVLGKSEPAVKMAVHRLLHHLQAAWEQPLEKADDD